VHPTLVQFERTTMGRIGKFRFWALTGVALSLASLTPARAQDPDDAQRGVARISLINGDVSVRRGDSGEWVAAAINAPLLADDHVATGPNSRTEVEFDASNVLRLGANAQMHLAQLEYSRYQMEIAHGVATFRMLRNTDINVEIDTPSVSVRPSRQGSYRVSVNDAGETEITARGGDVEIFTPHGSQWVRSGQTMIARGAASDPEFQIVGAGAPDDWDRWCDSRDRTILQSNSSRYIPQGVYGGEDLDNYGNWVSTPDYGYVWQPTVAQDWAPYQAGRWVWEDWYGWTWVSYDPWGWAPYHYGRWFSHPRYGWCWYPGAIGVRHYWSPALVGWFGFGGGGGFGFGFGNVGWVPLAPFEVFHPWWGRGFYGRGFNRVNVNITNINVTNVYRNARVVNGVSAVGVHDFQAGRFNQIARLNGNSIGNVGAVRGAMPFTPGSQNLRFTDRQTAVAPRTANTAFFRQQQPGRVERMPIGRPQGATNPGTLPNAGARGNDAGAGFRRFGSPAGPSAAPQSNAQPMQQRVERNGFGRTGENLTPRNDRPQGAPQGGWNRFGSPGNGAPQAPRQDSRQNFQQNNRPQVNAPSAPNGPSGRQEPLRVAPPVVRERPSAPQYQAPRQSAPSYSPPPRQSAPSYSPPPRQSAPSFSAPRGNSGGGGGGSHPSGGGGGGGNSRPSGGGGGGHSGGNSGGHGGGRR
jgi:hypothetical protein